MPRPLESFSLNLISIYIFKQHIQNITKLNIHTGSEIEEIPIRKVSNFVISYEFAKHVKTVLNIQ